MAEYLSPATAESLARAPDMSKNHNVAAAPYESLPSPASDTHAMLWQCFLRDTVRTAVGIVAAEVWLERVDGTDTAAKTVLQRPVGGWYLEPAFVNSDDVSIETARHLDTLCSSPAPTQPSIGLSGELWASAAEAGGNALRWKVLSALAANEDAPSDARKTAAAGAFGLVGVQPLAGASGVLLLYTRRTDSSRIESPRTAGVKADAKADAKAGSLANQLIDSKAFFLSQAHIGGAIAASEAVRAALLAQKRARSSGMRKLRALHRSGMLAECVRRERDRLGRGETSIAVVKPASRQPFVRLARHIAVWTPKYLIKWRGVQAAPKLAPLRSRPAWETCAWTWFGVALTMLCLSALSNLTLALSDGEYKLLLGSFGALVTLLVLCTRRSNQRPAQRPLLKSRLLMPCLLIPRLLIPSRV